jgi:hypothetical protein
MTATKTLSIREILNQALPDKIADAMRLIKFGNMMSVVKVAFTGLTSSATHNISDAAHKAAGAISGITLVAGENLPPIGEVLTLRVVTGTATGHRDVTDVGGTPSTSLATLSDDGKTLVFEAVITAFTLQYIPRAAVSMDSVFAPST